MWPPSFGWRSHRGSRRRPAEPASRLRGASAPGCSPFTHCVLCARARPHRAVSCGRRCLGPPHGKHAGTLGRRQDVTRVCGARARTGTHLLVGSPPAATSRPFEPCNHTGTVCQSRGGVGPRPQGRDGDAVALPASVDTWRKPRNQPSRAPTVGPYHPQAPSTRVTTITTSGYSLAAAPLHAQFHVSNSPLQGTAITSCDGLALLPLVCVPLCSGAAVHAALLRSSDRWRCGGAA